MKKLAIIASTLVMSSTVFAGIHTLTTNSTIKSEGYQSEAQALDAGYSIMDELNSESPYTLSQNIQTTNDYLLKNSTKIRDMEVEVEKYSRTRGEVEYRVIVDVDYEYKVRKDRRD
ncbi:MULTISPECIES: DUF3316 domain-containing protein [Aliivibrio]|uniref:DUF3316 domain-containing protein n=1 Tax=Aliivibrio finisterrensis TaxID=511998 RepID=A0A4Q5KSN6_9GAMM|nr:MULTISPECIES: DUF3316 domain-containing protein [Aliivibrio]MDD9179718.1 DUF3316 domain-containing protein [Aliivibrio sp. A6]RYU50547.1 DUF3316 domain-containing protein [Aliivibrio finisterrensis]RYU52167.1 DUF3316 domain-containing protein [Aliivibrio finisterrensis]RYU57229.1 DUF3316 domain-containing protein [Aliivibrio finisterrensis]RYU63640.1 DUF3316 domain-containing protein [Aliivibrio finisterrensis]